MMMNAVNKKDEYPMGASVVIRNLINVPELNGCIGIVKSQHMPLVDGRQAIVLLAQQKHHQQQQHERQRRVVSIKPVNLQFEPRAVENLLEKEMKLVLAQKGVDVSNMPPGGSAKAPDLWAMVMLAVGDGKANIDNGDNDDAISIEIGRILGLDTAEKDAVKKIESVQEGCQDPVKVDKVYEAKLQGLSHDPPNARDIFVIKKDCSAAEITDSSAGNNCLQSLEHIDPSQMPQCCNVICNMQNKDLRRMKHKEVECDLE
jgi:hypothetical protein